MTYKPKYLKLKSRFEELKELKFRNLEELKTIRKKCHKLKMENSHLIAVLMNLRPDLQEESDVDEPPSEEETESN
ncbi:hypothetical protein CONCODRAFT_79438 [Conidiobolus coronatus NRRL 28638]|uniref:Uncharacterized protein n=1 Tax=Conidiobolus coronatus (strain ATCC 28846 / CBS 209.66 / NRRL 28638) TaxID=796925 RepID=A0A137P2Q5_CONC2|nr:hypothetical protein CONCODRAFT_79438 [Conidiobolus coronatus NRRL 28638]|eukprot:KXN69184.1 hypothetical protein CONCODRAFT_79438 [Conidiobolus coronatus NRRL 28638]